MTEQDRMVLEALAAFAAGDYERRVPEGRSRHALAKAVNALGEELAGQQPLLEAQFDALLDQLVSLASFEFDRRVPADHGGDGYRALATGLNMLTEELQSVVEARDRVQALYRLAFEHAPIGMVLAAADGTFLQVNRAFGDMLGKDPEDLVGRNWRDVTHPDDLEESVSLSAALNRGDIDRAAMEKRYIVAEGKVIWGHFSVAMVRDDAGRPIYTLAQVIDVTERKETADALRRARDRALESDRLKTEFLRNVSHEIRTPMTSMLGMTELALGTPLTDSQQEYLEIAMASGRHLLELVEGILQLSKIESGVLEPDIEPIDVRAAIKRALDPLRAQAELAGLEFGVAVADDVPDRACLDARWLGQILTNLAANAVKFTPAGRIDCRLGVESGELVLAVTDTGIGVPTGSHDLIFEPFRQADGSTTRRFGGTGLGLAITARLVDRLGGSVDVADRPGGGTAFTVRLPLVRPDESRRAATPTNAPTPRLDGIAALVAEDRVDHLVMIRRALEAAGCEVSAVRNGREAVAMAAGGTFDVALMDMQMPELDGLDAIAAIRASEELGTARLPILAVTAHALDIDRDRALAAGADDYLVKPFTTPDLIRAVAATLTAPRA